MQGQIQGWVNRVARFIYDSIDFPKFRGPAADRAGRNARRLAICASAAVSMLAGTAFNNANAQQASGGAPGAIMINGYTVKGNHLLSELEIDNAVYPFLGPGQTVKSVDAARAALQKAYADKGYETVAVQIPPQHVEGGVVLLQVVEAPIGRLDVKGSRYFSLKKIKAQAPSLAPGQVPNFKRIKHDLIALNQWPDRQVIPALQAGVQPQTIDVNLNVKDTFPLHGSLSLDNRYSPDTTPLRIDGSLTYDNLWQRGDTLNAAFEVAPQNTNDALVFSGSYLARTNINWLTLLFYGLVSNSDVSTLGSTNVVGRGQVAGFRALTNLPGGSEFFDSLSTGIDYKNFIQNVNLGGATVASPVTYYPITSTYSATWQGDTGTTQLDIGPTFNIRGFGSGPVAFDNKRFEAETNFIYARGDLSRLQDLPSGFQLFVKAQGQLSDEPLVNSEQFSIGGQDTVRGYLESEVLGDDAIVGSVEFRSPQLSQYLGDKVNDWRLFLFSDDAHASILDPLPDQQYNFNLASVGAGTRIQLVNHLNGSVDVAVPLLTSVTTQAEQVRIEFKVWVQF
jgi:hemolysin activation/secretion protein